MLRKICLGRKTLNSLHRRIDVKRRLLEDKHPQDGQRLFADLTDDETVELNRQGFVVTDATLDEQELVIRGHPDEDGPTLKKNGGSGGPW